MIKIKCVMWKDKKLIFLMPTHASPIELLAIHNPLVVSQCDGNTCN